MICDKCKRDIKVVDKTNSKHWIRKAVEISGKHSYYGCDSGCCGYRITLYDETEGEVYSKFYFDHPDTEDEAIDLLLLEDNDFDGEEHFIKSLKRDLQNLGDCY